MGTYLDVQGDPNEVSATGAMLRSLGDDLKAKTQEILGTINGIEGERPWGSDKYGQAFESTYHVTPQGGDERFVDSLKTGLGKGGDRLITMGQATVMGMTDIQGTDGENGGTLRNVSV